MRPPDLVVAGGGVAGLAAAAHAAGRGARVIVLEKDDRLGGAGALSAGIVWTAPDLDTFRRVCPDGDPELGRVLVDGFDPAVEAVRATGVEVSERWSGQMGFGLAHRVDIAALLRQWAEAVTRAGGRVELGRACQRAAARLRRRGPRCAARRRRGARGGRRAARHRRLSG